jgi:hypothetical protein
MTYKASLDKTAITITTGVTILFAVIIAGQFALIKNEGHASPVYTTTAVLLIYLLTFAFRPLNYTITENEVVIRRPLKNVRLKRSAIAGAVLLDGSQLAGAIRTFGVGGLFGYYGSFTKFSLGAMTWYATRKDTPVLITMKDNKKIILTPDDPLRFVSELNASFIAELNAGAARL